MARTNSMSQGLSRRGFLKAAACAAAAGAMGACAGSALADAAEVPDEVGPATENADGSWTIVDRLGREVTFDKVPERVAMTIMPMPAIYYTVMGNTDTVVGCNPSSITAYNDSTLKDLYPELANASTDWCGTDFSVNIEELLKLEPDVVFQWVSQPESVESMEAAGLKVVALKYGTLAEMRNFFTLIGEVFKKEERVEFLLDYFDERTKAVTDITSQIPQEEWPQAIELYDEDTVVASGFMSYWIDGAGTVNPATELGGQAQNVDVNMEQIYTWNPDIIYIGNFSALKASDILENKIDGQDWSPVTAVQNAQVYKIPIGSYRWDPPSFESPLCLLWMAKNAHPEQFADIDMADELRQFYKDIFSYDISDEQIEMILGDTQD